MMGLPHMLSSLWSSLGGGGDDSTISVHPDTNDPNKAWDKLSVKQKAEKIKSLPNDTPVKDNKIRFVCVSDTHGRTPVRAEIPDGDVLLHAGDFSMIGKPDEIVKFNEWLGTLPHKHKIVIAGNHDLSFDEELMKDPANVRVFGLNADDVVKFKAERGISHMKEVLTNCTYLEDSETTVYGQRIFGSPWQPWFYDWGFNLERGQPCLDKWNLIPEGIDILLTHGPPIGHGDLCKNDLRAGCVELLQTIQKRVKCKYHIFGHIHEAYGMTTDGFTKYINACTCTYNYRPCNNAIIFDIDLPAGVTKSDFDQLPSVVPSSAEVADEEEFVSMEAEDDVEPETPIEADKKEEPKGPLVLEQNFTLEPTPAPRSSTSTATTGFGFFKS